MAADTSRRIDALIKVGLRLARNARSGRVLLARVAAAIELDWLPQPWGEEIAPQLTAAADVAREPLGWREVERLVGEAWGRSPAQELDELDRDPIRVTPSAQVHRGTLDGASVAVKVLRPGLAGTVRQDLVLLEGLLAPLRSAFPALDAGAVVAEFRERVLEELDLEHEAIVQRRFHRALRRHPFLVIPAPVSALSCENVLVSEWVDGVPLSQARDPDRAAAQLVLFTFGSMNAGIVHADPVPEDVLVLSDGRLGILDFGATRVMSAERAKLLAGVLDAFAAGNGTALGAALAKIGSTPPQLGPIALRVAQHALGELGDEAPSRLDRDAVIAVRDRLLDDPQAELAELITAGTLPAEDLWPARSVLQTFATIARGGARGPWRELARAALHDGWEAGTL